MHQAHSNFADHASVLLFFMFVTFVLCYKPKRLNPCNKGSLSSLDIYLFIKRAQGEKWGRDDYYISSRNFLPNNLKKGLEEQSFSWQTVVFL